MITMNLSPEENEILIDVIQSYLSDLRMEIADTDRYDFRENLKHQKLVLLKVLDYLSRQNKKLATS